MSIQPFRRPRDAPAVRLLQFLIRVVRLVPRLMAELEAGHVEAGQKLGRRRLGDGRTVELWLVARAPRRASAPLVRGHDDPAG